MNEMMRNLIEECLYESVFEQHQEIERLRQIIKSEGVKWEAHHSDPIKKMYWREFAGKAEESKQ